MDWYMYIIYFILMSGAFGGIIGGINSRKNYLLQRKWYNETIKAKLKEDAFRVYKASQKGYYKSYTEDREMEVVG